MYQIGQKVVYPMYGAGEICAIEEREVLGKCQQYYILQMPLSELQVMVPVNPEGGCQLREVIGAGQAQKILEEFSHQSAPMCQNWNKRYRENLARIKSGDIGQIVEVVRGLMLRERERSLSTGERKMLISAKNILLSELSMALRMDRITLEEQICDRLFQAD